VTKHLLEKSAPGTSEQVLSGLGGVHETQGPCSMPTGTWMRLHRVLAGKNHSPFIECHQGVQERSRVWFPGYEEFDFVFHRHRKKDGFKKFAAFVLKPNASSKVAKRRGSLSV
jgi:hypothetical protein